MLLKMSLKNKKKTLLIFSRPLTFGLQAQSAQPTIPFTLLSLSPADDKRGPPVISFPFPNRSHSPRSAQRQLPAEVAPPSHSTLPAPQQFLNRD